MVHLTLPFVPGSSQGLGVHLGYGLKKNTLLRSMSKLLSGALANPLKTGNSDDLLGHNQ